MDIWVRLKKGDKEALGQLYDLYADRLYAYGMRIVSNSAVVEDAIQAIFVNLFERRAVIATPNYPLSYLCVSLRRLLLRDATKQRKHCDLDGINDLETFRIEIDVEQTIMHSERKREEVYMLQKSLDLLTPRQREAVYLKYYNDLNNDEIAEAMNISNQSVRNLISSALILLRESSALKMSVILFLLTRIMLTG